MTAYFFTPKYFIRYIYYIIKYRNNRIVKIISTISEERGAGKQRERERERGRGRERASTQHRFRHASSIRPLCSFAAALSTPFPHHCNHLADVDVNLATTLVPSSCASCARARDSQTEREGDATTSWLKPSREA